MKISIAQSDLHSAIQSIQRAVSAKSILPVLTGVLLSVERDHIDLYATDLELSIRHRIIVKSDVEERVVVPARLLSDIVKNLPDGRVDIDIDTKSNIIRLICGSSAFDIKTMPAEDFPKFPELKEEKTVTLPSNKLTTAIKQVIRAVSKDETRPVLCGILVVLDKGRLKMVSTDSYRLSVYEAAVDGVVVSGVSVIVPARCMDEIAKISGDIPLQIGITQNQIHFTAGNTTIVSRLIEGNFIPYQQLLPESCDLRVKINKEEFAHALRRVALLAQNNALVKIKLGEGAVQLSAITADIGSASESITADMSGSAMEIAFNAQYLIDGLNSITDDEVLLELINPLKPGILRPGSAQDFIYLAMPVRIG
ncbi:MAG TPA: DNA polymerase III subunit beta [Candidatus Aquicultor sp.]